MNPESISTASSNKLDYLKKYLKKKQNTSMHVSNQLRIIDNEIEIDELRAHRSDGNIHLNYS